MKSLPFILLALAALSLASCSGTTVYGAMAATGIWYTQPKAPPPADTADQIAQHDNWCYASIGYAECYPQIQNTQPERLINVDPQNKYPLSARNYQEAVYEDK